MHGLIVYHIPVIILNVNRNALTDHLRIIKSVYFRQYRAQRDHVRRGGGYCPRVLGHQVAGMRILHIYLSVSGNCLTWSMSVSCISCQVENGIIKNWEDMEHLWNYTFFEKLVVRLHACL